MQAQVVKCARGLGIGDNIGSTGCSITDREASTPRGLGLPIKLCVVIDRVESLRPRGETRVALRSNFRHSRVLQVGVRIDEAGHQYPVYVVFDERSSRLLKCVNHPVTGSHVFDSSTGNRNSTVQDGWSGDGDDKTRRIDLDYIRMWGDRTDLCVIWGNCRHRTIVHCLSHEVHQAQHEIPHHQRG